MTIIGKIAKDYCKEISSIDNIWETLYELLSNNLLCSNVLNALNNILIEYIYIILYLLFNSESLVRAFLKTEGLSILSNLSVYIYYIKYYYYFRQFNIHKVNPQLFYEEYVIVHSHRT